MRKLNSGVLTLAVLGGIFAYRNRFRLQRFLESRGINVPVFGRNIVEKAQSTASKLIGRVEHTADVINRESPGSFRRAG